MKNSKNVARWSAVSLAVGTLCPAFSQTSLPEVVVTATRSESRASELISDLSVITRQDIEANGGRTLTELLARSAGVQMAANGGLGKNSNLFIRGTDSRHVLLLVDGVRFGSSTTGAPNFDTIPLELIDHIEVLKGPASALYGSDAVGGVVQIFTKKGTTGVHPYASVTAGEYNHTELSAGVSGGDGGFNYSLGAQTLHQGGFSASNSRASKFTYNPDADGFSQDSGNLSLSWKFIDHWNLKAFALQSDGNTKSDSGTSSTFDTRTDFSSSVMSLGLDGAVSDRWKTSFKLGSGTDKTLYYSSNTPSRIATQQDQISWQNEVQTSLGKVLVGVENLREYVNSTTNYAVADRSTDSQYAGVSGATGAHSWQFNLRRDANSQFGNANTGLLGYGFTVLPDWRIHGSYGTSFKAPTFNDLYYPGYSNPQLLAEVGRNTEVGTSYVMGAHLLRMTYYKNYIQNYVGKTSAYVPFNIPQAVIEGATISLEGEFGDWRYYSVLNTLNARNESNGLMLQRRPGNQLTAGVDHQTGAWSYGFNLLTVDDFYDDVANRQVLGGYATVDVHVAYAVQKDWSVESRVVNLGDKFYQTAYGYNQSGRALYMTLRYQPK